MTVSTQDIVAVLGLKRKGATSLDLAEAIEQGLPVAAADRIVKLLAPEDPSFAQRIAPRATLARRRRNNSRLSMEEGDRTARFARIWSQALSVWNSAEAARRFLFEPHQLLEGKRPVDVIRTAVGARMVEEILGRLEHGSVA